MNKFFRSRSLQPSCQQTFLFHKKKQSNISSFSRVHDSTGNNFIPLPRLHSHIPRELHIHAKHILSLIKKQQKLEWPTKSNTLHMHQSSWEALHTLGVIALVDSTMQRITRVLYHAAATATVPFFDFGKIKQQTTPINYRVTLATEQTLIVSHLLLTVLTTPNALTFFRKTTDVTPDECALIQYVLAHSEPFAIAGEKICIPSRPIFFRYIHVQDRIMRPGTLWKQGMNTILYF